MKIRTGIVQPLGQRCDRQPRCCKPAGGLTNEAYAQTDRLPAEVNLATELGVSRHRDVTLSEMERAGYVERVRGIGTVVNRAVVGCAAFGPEAGYCR